MESQNGRIHSQSKVKLPWKKKKSQIPDPNIPTEVEGQNEASQQGASKLVLTRYTMMYMIELGHCLLWCTPFRCTNIKDPHIQIATPISQLHRIGNLVSLCGSILFVSLQILGIILEIQNGTFTFHSGLAPYRLTCTFMLTLVVIFEINMKWKAQEFCDTWESIMGHGKHLSRQSVKKMDELCATFIILLMAGIGMIQFLWFLLFVFNCKYHMLGSIFSVCAEGGGHVSLLWFGFHLGIHAVTIGSGAIYLCMTASLVLVAVYGGNLILQDLRTKALENTKYLRTSKQKEKWNISFRCLNMFNARQHNAIGEVVSPVFFFLVIVIMVMSNYTILAPQVELIVKCQTIIGNLAFVVFLVIVLKFATGFPEESEYVLALRKLHCSLSKSDSGYTHRHLASCRPMRIFVGNFFYMSRNFLPNILAVVLEYTINVLLS